MEIAFGSVSIDSEQQLTHLDFDTNSITPFIRNPFR
jgi:hypothetical protein